MAIVPIFNAKNTSNGKQKLESVSKTASSGSSEEPVITSLVDGNLKVNHSQDRSQDLSLNAPAPYCSFENLGLNFEYSSSEAREILQPLFPKRQLVLSQFTFFNQVGIAKATGQTKKKGRRCYSLQDLLSIATILSLKEEGIPFKNIPTVPKLIQAVSKEIFVLGPGCRLSGFGNEVGLILPFKSEHKRSNIRIVPDSSEHQDLEAAASEGSVSAESSVRSPTDEIVDEELGEKELKELGLGKDALELFLSLPSSSHTFWSIDLGMLASSLQLIAVEFAAEHDEIRANSGLVA